MTNTAPKAVRTRLGSQVEFRKGFAFKSSWYADRGFPIVKVSDFTDSSVDPSNLVCIAPDIAQNYVKYQLETDDVVIQTVGSWPSNPDSVVGKVIRVPATVSGALLNQNAVKVLPSASVDRRFLFYRLRCPDFKAFVVGTAQGAASQAAITLESIRAFEFALPDYESQRRVADILSAYDDLIENNTRRMKILEEMANMIYREWFITFRFPGHEKIKMADSAIGLVPTGWRVGVLQDAVVLQRGFDLPTAQRQPGSVPIFAATGINGTHSVARVEGPGVVTGRSGSLGTVHLVLDDFWPLNTTLWVKEFRQSSPAHAYFMLQDLQLSGFNSGAAVPTLNRNDIHNLPTILPETKVLDAFGDCVMPLFLLQRNLKAKNTNLRTTRDLLLPRLISGEINVEHAETEAVAQGV